MSVSIPVTEGMLRPSLIAERSHDETRVKLSAAERKSALSALLPVSRPGRGSVYVGIASHYLVWVDNPTEMLQHERRNHLQDSFSETRFHSTTRVLNIRGFEVRYSRSREFPLYATIIDTDNQQAVEKLEFHDPKTYEFWRRKLAKAFVVFDGFNFKYKILAKLGKDGLAIAYLLRATDSGRLLQGKFREHSSSAFEKVQKEAEILQQLSLKSLVPEFLELTFHNNTIGIIQEHVDGVPFGDWFRDVWCYRLGSKKGGREVSQLMCDVAEVVNRLNEAGVCHNGLNRHTLMVKVFAEDASPSPRSHADSQFDGSSIGYAGPISPARSLFQQSSFLQKLLKPVSSKSGDSNIGTLLPVKNISERGGQGLDYAFYFTGLSQATIYQEPTLSIAVAQKPKHPKHSIEQKPLNGSHLQQNNTKASRYAADVHDLALIFAEVIYGIDTGGFACRPTITKTLSVLENSILAAIANREPLYNIDSRVIAILLQMLDPDPKKRPLLANVVSSIKNILKDQSVKEEQVPQSGIKSPHHLMYLSRLSFDRFDSSILKDCNTRKSKGFSENMKCLLTPSTAKNLHLNTATLFVRKKSINSSDFRNLSYQATKLPNNRSDIQLDHHNTSKDFEVFSTQIQTSTRKADRRISLFAKSSQAVLAQEMRLATKPKPATQHNPSLLKLHEIGLIKNTETMISPRDKMPRRSASTPAVIWFGRQLFKHSNKLKPVNPDVERPPTIVLTEPADTKPRAARHKTESVVSRVHLLE